MKLTIDTQAKCPRCKANIEVETGFLAGLFLSAVLASRKATVTKCPKCGYKKDK
jgi:predicted RNA-binding Zn-ribbon protein involved in translation (DUF1610 family)